MFIMENTNLNFNGKSEKNDVVIATFNASKNNNSLYISANIEDVSLFDATTFNADFDSFKTAVLEGCDLVSEA